MATVNKVSYAKQSGGGLGAVKRYVEREDKTYDEELKRRLITGQNCTPEFADHEFIATREAYRKESPTWFHHYTQSFSPKENVTPEEAHKVAVEFAKKAWPDMEVVIATHLDAEHLHSHFLVNAVSFKTGKMLHEGPHNIQHLRELSDEICFAHNLSVLPKEQTKTMKGMSAREYRSAEKGQSWKFRLMVTIDDCMKKAGSKQEFVDLMRSEGYEVKWTDERKSITYTTPSGMKCRDIKLHEEKYLKEMMEREFEYRRVESAESQRRYDSADGRADHDSYRKELDSAAEFGIAPVASAGGNRSSAQRTYDLQRRRETAGSDRAEHSEANIPAPLGDEFVQLTGWEDEREFFLRRREAGYEYGEGAAFADGLDAGQPRRDAARDRFADGQAVQRDDTLAQGDGSSMYRGGDDANGTLRHDNAAAAGISAALGIAAALDDDDEDADERRRKIEAREAAQNLGTAIGLAAGLTLGLSEKHRQQQEEQQNLQQNTMTQSM